MFRQIIYLKKKKIFFNDQCTGGCKKQQIS